MTLAAEPAADETVEVAGGRAALWWRHTPALPGERVGAIGRFQAGSEDDARRVLDEARRVLRERGCTLALGPMDGNTWRAYRFVTRAGERAPFVFEPRNPPEYPLWWERAGFSVREEYVSAQTEALDAPDPRTREAAARLGASGVRWRPLDMTQFDKELERIFQVSLVSFRNNTLYSPIALDEFKGLYLAARELLDPRLSFLAEREERPVGFVFALPDAEQARRGERVDTVVVKTLAVLPGREHAGLGKVLLETCQGAAMGLGYRRAIHALMHVRNGSRNLGRECGEIRRYALFGSPVP